MAAWVYLDPDGFAVAGGDRDGVDAPSDALELAPGTRPRDVMGRRFVDGSPTDERHPDLLPSTPAEVANGRTIAARAEGLERFIGWLDAQAETISGRVPAAERQTWLPKEEAAKRVAAGAATSSDLSLLSIEAALVGEEMAVTVAKILTNAAMFRVAGPLISGLRRHCARVVLEAPTPEAVDAAVAAAQARFAGVLADPLAFAADPAGWLAAH